MKRTWTQLWVVLLSLAITGTVWPLSLTSPPRVAHAAPSTLCGTERWDVKTLADPGAAGVDLTPITATVEELRAMPVPGPLALHTPRYPQETKTYRVTARLAVAALERDHDYHLVLAGSTSQATMIVEIPDPACVASHVSAVVSGIARTRAYFDQTFGAPSAAPQFTTFSGTPTISVTGVLFFDTLHGQRGVAPNGVELHPVLDLQKQ